MSVTAPPRPDTAPPPARDDGRSITDLLKDLRDESTTLVRQEVSLAKTELSEKVNVYGRNAGKIAAGAALAFASAVALLLAVASAAYFVILAIGGGEDAEEWVHWVAGLVGFVGVPLLALAIGGFLIKSAVDQIRRTSPVPEQTIASVKADARHMSQDIQDIKHKVTPR